MKPNSTLALAVGAVLLTAMTGSVEAIPSTNAGILSFSGSSRKTDTSNLKHSSKFMEFGTVMVGADGTLSGDYARSAGATAVFTPSMRTSVGAIMPIKSIWIFESGGNTYAFHPGSLGVDFRSQTALVMSGFGTTSTSGPVLKNLKTPGMRNWSGQTPGEGRSTFPASTIVPSPGTNRVPDGGATALLLGFSVWGFGLLKRKSTA